MDIIGKYNTASVKLDELVLITGCHTDNFVELKEDEVQDDY